MPDLSATRRIESVTTINQTFFVLDGMNDNSYFDEITTTEKQGNGEFVMVIWYRCWRNNHIVREINSLYVVDVCYFEIIPAIPARARWRRHSSVS